ncbi:unnamed protein product [Moneuplotes crassus]|uniref:USP domain-containing protein n=1 Tax=Euplotes crassus TaxID=5936 RepID=A0AAD1Y087_EUPCR|nr:unnamed protein product [Moneuplotes crassus]
MSENSNFSRNRKERGYYSTNKRSISSKATDLIQSNVRNIKNKTKTRGNERRKSNALPNQKYAKNCRSIGNKPESPHVKMSKRKTYLQSKTSLHEKKGMYDQAIRPRDINHIKYLYSAVTKHKNITERSSSKNNLRKQQCSLQQVNIPSYSKNKIKRKTKPKQKDSQTIQTKVCRRLYEEHKERQIRKEQRMKEKEREEREICKITKYRRKNRKRKEGQIKEEEAKFNDEMEKIEKEEQKLREEKERMQKEHQERVEILKHNSLSFEQESSNKETSKRKPSFVKKLENLKNIEKKTLSSLKQKTTQQIENKNPLPNPSTEPQILPPSSKAQPSIPKNLTSRPPSHPPTTTLRPTPSSRRSFGIKSQRISPIKQKEIHRRSVLDSIHEECTPKTIHRRKSLSRDSSKHEEEKVLGKKKHVRRKTAGQNPLGDSRSNALCNMLSSQKSSFEPTRTTQNLGYSLQNSLCETPTFKSKSSTRERMMKILEEEKKESKQTGFMNKSFLMKEKKRKSGLISYLKFDEDIILEEHTSEISYLECGLRGKVIPSYTPNIISDKYHLNSKENKQVASQCKINKNSTKQTDIRSKNITRSITTNQSTREETKEDDLFYRRQNTLESSKGPLSKTSSLSRASEAFKPLNKNIPIPCKGIKGSPMDCFYKASLQCVLSASSFTRSFLDANLSNSSKEIFKESTVTAKFTDFVNNYCNSSKNAVNAEDLRGCFIDDFPQSEQHDATQFILSLFEKLKEEQIVNAPVFKSSGHKSRQAAWKNYQKDHTSIIDKLFVGMNLDFYKCKECRDVSKIYQEFNYIPVYFEEDQKNYKINFKKICSTKESSKVFCNQCKSITKYIIKTKITKFPQYLLLSIQRSSTNNMDKRDELMKYEEKVSIDIGKGKTKYYSLISVICHIKGNNNSHYESYCKRGDTWRLFDDSIVKKVDYPHNKKNAYILLYESK